MMVITCVCVEIVFWRYIFMGLMGVELGTETNISLLVGFSAMFPPIFALIGNDNFLPNFVC